MRKILTAMANITLNNELKKYRDFDVYEEDLYYQDAVLDVVSNEKFDVLLVSALLQGQLEFIDFIEKIKKKDGTIRIIVITDEISSSLKRKFAEYEVTDIFLDDEVEIPEIIDAINREEPLRKKIALTSNKSEKEDLITTAENTKNEYSIQRITQKQEIITVSGINGAGKTTIAANFARTLASKTTAKVLLIDLDTLNGNLDEILEINKVPPNVEIMIDENKKCGLNYAAELISKNRFDVNVFDELLIDAGSLDVLTGNTSLHFCQNVLSEAHYEKILECAKEKYDFIIIDTSSNIFLDSTKWALQVASRVFFVTENNYISMKKSMQLLNVITDTWGIWKDKIEMIINKESGNGIDVEVVKKILKDYGVIGRIRLGEEGMELSYTKILESIHYIPKVSFFSKFFATKSMDTITTNRIPTGKLKREGVMPYVN